MSLESFRREKLVVLQSSATVLQAGRAMAENHIGAVLVSHAGQVAGIVTDRDLALSAALLADQGDGQARIEDVMSDGVLVCSVNDSLADAVRLMRDAAVRRVPIVDDNGALAGIVTFDDLVLSTEVDRDDLRAILREQLVETETTHKPAGVAYPVRAASGPARRLRLALRADARAGQVHARLVADVAAASGLDRDRAARGLLLGVCLICHRITAHQARHLIAQLPSRMHAPLGECADGPTRALTAASMNAELARTLNLDESGAADFLRTLFTVLAGRVSPGQMREVVNQLPPDLAALFPPARAA